MKKFILMLSLSVLGAGVASANTNSVVSVIQQGGGQGQQGTPEERADRQVKMMNEMLTLTADQSTKVRGILLEQSKEMAVIREKNQGNRDAMMEAMRPLREKYTAQIKAVLTAEQFTKYEANAAQFRGGRGGQGGNGGGQSNR